MSESAFMASKEVWERGFGKARDYDPREEKPA